MKISDFNNTSKGGTIKREKNSFNWMTDQARDTRGRFFDRNKQGCRVDSNWL